MNITIKLLLLLYLLLMITVTIFGFAWTLTAIFAPKWATKKASIMRQEKTFNHMK
ncbi:MAG: hypothetical protein LJE83_07080 [Gammaproteobacteria bacterium]|nr:hypothetical protein [Gammaproteobacteria bacterium]